MSEKFSLKDHLFNASSIEDLADEFAVLPGFDGPRFHSDVMGGLPDRELMERLDWIADCVQSRLSDDFPTMVDQLITAMPPKLDHTKTDDDFGRFIHAVPGILAVRHGLELHRDLALDLIYEATQRFSMEFYIRPFINRWPDETLARLQQWAGDDNYHVRRLVSEGTRARLPWAGRINLDVCDPIPFLDQLHSDPTRYVTRSVANHLNDIAKSHPDLVVTTLRRWENAEKQKPKELAWMTRHALRTLIKQGHPGAMDVLGYRVDADVSLQDLTVLPSVPRGGVQDIKFTLLAPQSEPVIVDFVLHSVKSDGSTAPKVFKLKQAKLAPNTPMTFVKSHRFKDNATTFTLYPGTHRIDIQVNGKVLGGQDFELV
ncbi:hypothetical protein [Aestuariibius sp. HNIBRBA575]|uniref:hypothetical protein n=1 Tax=Aestuariibius sp. HNIBRBA575 TaxID=3233343 RepID=UPI0034A1659A